MGIFNIFKKKDNKPAEVKTPVSEPEIAPQSVPKRVWDTKYEHVELIDGVLKKMGITRDENDDYTMKKKDLLDEYCDGDKIWKYEPYEFDKWRLDGMNVYACDDYGEEFLIGTVRKRASEDIIKDQPDRPDMQLFGGRYKQIDDDEIVSDSEDLSVVICYEKLQK